MAFSNPTIRRADIPSSVPPNNSFPVEVEIEQGGEDPWASDGNCVSPNLSITAWKTPVELVVDGEVMSSTELCLAPGNAKTTTLHASIPTGSHTVEVRVFRVGGNTFDPAPMVREENDDVVKTVKAEAGSPDPSEAGAGDRIIMFLEDVAGTLGTSVSMVALGALLAVGVFLFI